MISPDIIRISTQLRQPYAPGWFGVYRPKTHRITTNATCREVFGRAWFARRTSRDEYVAYVAPDLTEAKLAQMDRLFTMVETALGVREPSVLYRVETPVFDNVVWPPRRLGVQRCEYAVVILVSPFWRAMNTTRDVFTLLLRCFAAFAREQDTPEKALARYPLARQCLPALKRFLKGHTHASQGEKDMRGLFVWTFGTRDRTHPISSLVRPTRRSPLAPHLADESLAAPTPATR